MHVWRNAQKSHRAAEHWNRANLVPFEIGTVVRFSVNGKMWFSCDFCGQIKCGQKVELIWLMAAIYNHCDEQNVHSNDWF